MNVDKIMSWGMEKMKFTDETPLEVGYRYYHGLRSAKLAVALAEGMGLEVNREVLYVGSFLHDVGKAGYKGPDHGPRGAELIEAEIAHLFSSSELELVLSMVANHYMRPNSKHFAGKEKPVFPSEVLLIQDADTLDHFGSNGVWLAFHWSVHHAWNQREAIDFYNTDDPAWRLAAFEWLNYDLSRQELVHRIARIDAFYATWQQEEAGGLTSIVHK